MDPLTSAALSTTLVPLVSGAAGEAGKAAWASLAQFVRGRFGGSDDPVDAVERQPDLTTAEALAAAVLDLAAHDPDVDAWLREWYAKAPTVSTVNSVSGTVHGHVVQAHSIGSISFPARD